ncbi:MAG: isoquinoline 1-oxidoreductase [Gemmatimonadetes bacterium]|nr:isoquinoline 1-oxidoreductase [Gemmatimonadota bacterium]
MTSTFSRRAFLRTGAAAGAGLTLAVQLGCSPRGRPGAPVTTPFEPNAFLRVSTDGSVTVLVGFSEMGQGVLTAIPQLVAEELDAEWEQVRVEQAPAGEAWNNPMFGIQGTGGSTSVRAAYQPMREAGARARAMLIAAAASQWNVPADQCTTEPGAVVHQASGKRAGYGSLAELAGTLPVPEQVTLKDPKQFRLIGKAVPRTDLAGKVQGAPIFGLDAAVPGALVAVVARCPVFGGKARTWDEAAARAVPGVKHVVQVSSGVAVVADGYWSAAKGREALNVQWDEGNGAAQSSSRIAARLAELTRRPGLSAIREGTVAAGASVVEALYEAPFLAHACMEPMNATVHIEADKATVWAPTQFASGAGMGGGTREVVARIAGLSPEQVTVHVTMLGGGFGRRFFQDFTVEAAETAKATGAPVKLVWSREDDIRHDFYRPVSTVRFTAHLDAAGTPVGLRAVVASPDIVPAGAGKFDEAVVEALRPMPYAFGGVDLSVHNPDLGVPTGWWRSVGSSQNVFFLESFVDELAAAAGKDPFEFRRALLEKSPRHKRVLELAAEKAGWGSPLPAGRARGIAVAESFGSYVAEVAEVSLERGVPKVHRVVCAFDCGPIVNPDIIAAQVESAVVFGLTAALYGEITIEGGRAVQGNFDTYPLLGMAEMPVVETHIVPSTDSQGGVGEPATPPIAPAVANALAALTGKRVRRLPLGKAFAQA